MGTENATSLITSLSDPPLLHLMLGLIALLSITGIVLIHKNRNADTTTKRSMGFLPLLIAVLIMLLTFSQNVMILAAWGSIVVAVVAFISLYESDRRERNRLVKERKRQALDKIVEWTISLANIPLSVALSVNPSEYINSSELDKTSDEMAKINVIKQNMETMNVIIDFKKVLEYGISLVGLKYIAPLVENEFKDDLYTNLSKVKKELENLVILMAKIFGMEKFQDMFPDYATNEVERRLKEKDMNSLYEEYAMAFSKSCSLFLKRAADIRTNL